MNIIKYVYMTSWAQIRQDIAQYMELRRRCAELKRECALSLSGLIRVAFPMDAEKCGGGACLLHEYMGANQILPDCTEDTFRHFVLVNQKRCPFFTDGKSIARCPKTECSCYKQNQDFYSVQAQYNAQVKLRDEFWREIFARLK